MTYKTILIGAVLLALTGCAPIISGAMNANTSDDDVYNKTAAYFGTTLDKLEFKNINKGALSTKYSVTHESTFYNCVVYYGEVKCSKPGEE